MKWKTYLSLETLEDRAVPAGGAQFGISLDKLGTLHIVGDDKQQDSAVWLADGQLHASMNTTVWKKIAGQMVRLTDFLMKDYSPSQVHRVSFNGKGDNDSFINETGLLCTVLGGTGDDWLTGGSGADQLNGGSGQDTLEGREGNDLLNGASGNDTYVFRTNSAPMGSDTIVFESANADDDTLDFSGLDTGVTIFLTSTAVQTVIPDKLSLKLPNSSAIEDVLGSSAADHISGNSRANHFWGNFGNDTIAGGAGNDRIWGGDGSGNLSDGSDLLFGATGDDWLWGENGNDTINAQDGNDRIDTGGGDNTVSDGLGNDRIDFNRNSVSVVFSTDGGNDTVIGSTKDDSITGSAGIDSLIGGLGNDTLKGGAGNDILNGSNGNDKLFGEAGNDTLDGEAGWDTLDGGSGNDYLYGGLDNDSLLGSDGRDKLWGDSGNDSLDGGLGRDTMDGGAGDGDKLFADQGNETLSNGEHVEITVPDGSPQNDAWSCGPNSGSRLLRSYGLDVSYQKLRADAQSSNIISDLGLGTPPPDLRDIMKKYKSDMHLKSNAEFQDILDRLAEGRPVVVLIGWGTLVLPGILGEPNIVPKTMHYVCLTGFDLESETLYYMDTDGGSSQFGFFDFKGKWNWNGAGIYYEALKAMGVKKQTMIW